MKSKASFIVAAFLFAVSGLWAVNPQAVLSSLKGKVEVRAPGATAWVAATEGQVLSPSATLSTGFDSSVVVVIDKTTIQVKPLTRLTIDKLVADAGTVKTSTFLRVGSVSASVKSAEGVKQDFKVQSPYSTASVRGTEFEYDGFKLKVSEGLVAFILGRVQREAAQEALAQNNSADYAGAPDVQGDPDQAYAVAAGKDAQLVVDYKDGNNKSVGSDDKDSLNKGAGQGQGQGGPNGKTKTQGGVSLTIQFVE